MRPVEFQAIYLDFPFIYVADGSYNLVLGLVAHHRVGCPLQLVLTWLGDWLYLPAVGVHANLGNSIMQTRTRAGPRFQAIVKDYRLTY